jgi:hypothetical protein
LFQRYWLSTSEYIFLDPSVYPHTIRLHDVVLHLLSIRTTLHFIRLLLSRQNCQSLVLTTPYKCFWTSSSVLKKRTLWNLHLFPSSGEVGRHLLCCTQQKGLTWCGDWGCLEGCISGTTGQANGRCNINSSNNSQINVYLCNFYLRRNVYVQHINGERVGLGGTFYVLKQIHGHYPFTYQIDRQFVILCSNAFIRTFNKGSGKLTYQPALSIDSAVSEP